MQNDHGKYSHYRAVLILLLVCILSIPALTSAESREYGKAGKKLKITVVEDGPELLDLEEAEVPLASFSDAGAKDRTGERHVILMGTALLAVTAYVWYFSRYEKRLSALRREAAEAEHRFLKKRRERNGRKDAT